VRQTSHDREIAREDLLRAGPQDLDRDPHVLACEPRAMDLAVPGGRERPLFEFREGARDRRLQVLFEDPPGLGERERRPPRLQRRQLATQRVREQIDAQRE
jgi:hypothetical protein